MRTQLMIAALTVGLVAPMLAGCDGFYAVQQEDSIEAYEEYLADHPNAQMRMQAETRLEELYLERAAELARLEAYDEYLEKFPEGIYREKAMEEREEFLYAKARTENTIETWQLYLDEYSGARKQRKSEARRAIKVLEYGDNLEIGPVRRKRVNMAENKDGPLDGWMFEADVTNNGDRTITYLNLALTWQLDGNLLERAEWPVVAESWPIPMADDKKAPIRPGQTRTWEWTNDDIPDDYDGPVSLTPVAIAFAE